MSLVLKLPPSNQYKSYLHRKLMAASVKSHSDDSWIIGNWSSITGKRYGPSYNLIQVSQGVIFRLWD